MKKITAIILSIIMILAITFPSSAISSTTKKSTNDSTAKKVTLNVILLGSKPIDCNKVFKKVNERMSGLINATLNPIFFDWGDWSQKYNLIFASGETFDLIYTANWAQYSQQAVKHGFLELKEDMLKKYAPKTYADVTPEQWTQTKINGKIFMVPYTKKEYNNALVMIRGDLRKKYNVPEVKTTGDLVKYWDAIAKNEKSILPFAAGGNDATGFIEKIFRNDPDDIHIITVSGKPIPYTLNINDKNEVSINSKLDDPKYIEYLKTLKDWKEKGYWSQSALANKVPNEQAFDNGTSATYIRQPLNINQDYIKNKLAHPDWQLEIINVNPKATIYANPVTNNGMGIHATSRNPERSLMALDLLRYDQQLNDLTTFGIEGEHYQAVGTDKYRVMPEGKNFAPDSACPWGWRTDLYRADADSPQIYMDTIAAWNKVAKVHPQTLFSFYEGDIKSEGAACAAVTQVNDPILVLGFAKDVDEAVKEYKSKLAQAGVEKVIKEYKKQLEEFLNKYGK